MRLSILFTCWLVLTVHALLPAAEPMQRLNVRISWGHRSSAGSRFFVKLVQSGVLVSDVKGDGLEGGEWFPDQPFVTTAGGGDIDGASFVLQYPPQPAKTIQNLNSIWRDLVSLSDPDTARRLRSDPAYRIDTRRLTLQMDRDGTKGFTIAVDQLIENKAIWIPSLDIYITSGDRPVPFAEHQTALKAFAGRRILDETHTEDEATYEQFKSRWEDMGSPAYAHPSQPAPGHIVCLSWDGSLHKFGIDRGGGVWPDYGNPDRFRFSYSFGQLGRTLAQSWKGQKLTDGLPVIVTTIERDGIRYALEQFAYPLNGPPTDRRGDVPMVLLQKLRLTNLQPQPRTVSLKINHERQLRDSAKMTLRSAPDEIICEEPDSQSTLFTIQGPPSGAAIGARPTTRSADGKNIRPATSTITLSLDLPAAGSRDLIIKLPSPTLPANDHPILLALDYAAARAATLRFWSDQLAQGATFRVPDPAVNELFRANLWHAMRLPRRHGPASPDVKLDLPYSNFAYDQNGIPWPINQGVYVDYMLYDLRGHHAQSAEDLLAMYRVNQEPSGHIRGYANWVVYTPGMVYASAQHYLLSGDRTSFEQLLPHTLKAADWCLAEINRAKSRSGPASGLVFGPLNDLTGEGVWAFNQAYIYAAFDLLAQALQRIDHPRANEFRTAAADFRKSVERAFAAAAMRSPLVQLRDHTWTPYIPCEALSAGRRMDQWYPTDVDTGALHLSRLKALAPDGPLTESLLNDHEDNLFLHGWTMANEPVYNQHATVYLLRDDPKPVIRAFYSMMACAFSHSAFEPVEHRWTWGQYFGPPSTDGAWFELYRNMLIQERDGDQLLLLAATPRKWLEDGNRIDIERAPTYFGPLTMTIQSQTATNTIRADITMPTRSHPKSLTLRLRHPASKPIRSATINGWPAMDIDKEVVRIANPDQPKYSIVVNY